MVINFLMTPDLATFDKTFNKTFFNSRTAIAGAIIGLLSYFFLFRRRYFCYDHMTSQPLQTAFCSFVHATEVRVRRHFLLLVERVFLFICVIKFLVTPDLPHSQK